MLAATSMPHAAHNNSHFGSLPRVHVHDGREGVLQVRGTYHACVECDIQSVNIAVAVKLI